jgi:hypothetical protein
VTIVLRKAAIIAAGNRGRRKAALAMAAARPRPITLAKVAWLERTILPMTERELTGKAPTRDTVKGLLATDRHENRISVRTPRSANVLRPERSDSERRSAAAVRAPTPEGAPLGAGFTAASEAPGLPLRGLLGTVRNPRFIWSAYARVAQGFARTNV